MLDGARNQVAIFSVVRIRYEKVNILWIRVDDSSMTKWLIVPIYKKPGHFKFSLWKYIDPAASEPSLQQSEWGLVSLK